MEMLILISRFLQNRELFQWAQVSWKKLFHVGQRLFSLLCTSVYIFSCHLRCSSSGVGGVGKQADILNLKQVKATILGMAETTSCLPRSVLPFCLSNITSFFMG